MRHNWQKLDYGKAKCKNCPWCRQKEQFDGVRFVTVYIHPNGEKKYHSPPCGEPEKMPADERYSVKNGSGEQAVLNFSHSVKAERILTIPMLKTYGNSFGKRH